MENARNNCVYIETSETVVVMRVAIMGHILFAHGFILCQRESHDIVKMSNSSLPSAPLGLGIQLAHKALQWI